MNPENKDLKQPNAGTKNWPFAYTYFDPINTGYIPIFWGDNQFVDSSDPFRYNPPSGMNVEFPLAIPKVVRFFRSNDNPTFSPPPPPGILTRTYTPCEGALMGDAGVQILILIRDLSDPSTYEFDVSGCGDTFEWTEVGTLPTVDELNALILGGSCCSGGCFPPDGVYCSSEDS